MKKPLLRIVLTVFSVIALLGVMLIILGATFSPLGYLEKEKQVKFSHVKHAKDAGIACVDCHKKAPESKRSSDNLLSDHESCQSCHEDQLSKNCTFCHTSANQETYQATELPDRKLQFSHEFHLAKQKMTCEKCHTGVAESEELSTIEVPAMNTCYSCHNDGQASNYCESCHTDISSLRPKDHNRTEFAREHKMAARVSSQSCTMCHSQETCIDCHTGSDLQQVTTKGSDLISPRASRLTAIDRGQGNRLLKVHEPNFKMTHGLSAKSGRSDCQVCHDNKTFCATCHMAGGNVNQTSFRPESHGKAGFTILGIGSGGGLHASLAKREIESCAACHDAQGADPACIRCHTDADGIKGTDPKTHTRGFMASNNGEWHTDPGSACYMCHNDANARVGGIKGRNFCGYCHK